MENEWIKEHKFVPCNSHFSVTMKSVEIEPVTFRLESEHVTADSKRH